MLAITGDQFSDIRPELSDGAVDEHPGEPEICGCTISVRPLEDIISVWHRTSADRNCVDRIGCVCVCALFAVPRDIPGLTTTSASREHIRRVLELPATTLMDYKSNNGPLAPPSVQSSRFRSRLAP